MDGFVYQVLHPWHWLTYGQNAAALYTLTFGISVVVLIRQLAAQARQLKSQALQLETQAILLKTQSFFESYRRLQTESMRAARQELYKLAENNTDFELWRQYENNIKAVEKVCQRYDYFAKMVRFKALPTDDVLHSWAWQVDKLWRVAKPYVKNRRERLGQGYLWEDFQWLAEQSAAWIRDNKRPGALPVD